MLENVGRYGAVGGFFFVALAGPALASEWRLVEVAGVVRVAAPGQSASPGRLNQTVPVGSSITTTAGARAKLDNGDQKIVLGPNSRLTVAPETSGFTRIVQDLGAAMFQVDKKQKPHFRVETPLLAAVVKGTTFTVAVGPQSDAVNVAEGLVEVRSNASQMGQDVGAGASGVIFRDAPNTVQVGAPLSQSGPPPAVERIEPLNYGAVTEGLVATAGAGGAAAAASGGLRAQMVGTGADAAPVGASTPQAVMATVAADAARNDVRPLQDGSLARGPDAAAPGRGLDFAPGQGGFGPGNSGSRDNGNGNGGGNGNPNAGPGMNNGNGFGNSGPANSNGAGNAGPGNNSGNGNGNAGPGSNNGNGNGNAGPGNNNGNGNPNAGPGNNNGNGNGGQGANGNGSGQGG